MVNSEGQLFTIEGIAAALILLATVYLVMNATSIYTAGDTHINDMQLEVIGSDALKMMNTPVVGANTSPLVSIVQNDDGAAFNTIFNNTLNNRTGSQSDKIQFMANVSYVRQDGTVNTTPLSWSRPVYGGEHAVHISQWIITENRQYPDCSAYPNYCKTKHAALVEVLLWRD
jgi:hypothetical protein